MPGGCWQSKPVGLQRAYYALYERHYVFNARLSRFYEKNALLSFFSLFFKNWPQILQVSPISDRLFFKMFTKS
jgi:hypothetical protein